MIFQNSFVAFFLVIFPHPSLFTSAASYSKKFHMCHLPYNPWEDGLWAEVGACPFGYAAALLLCRSTSGGGRRVWFIAPISNHAWWSPSVGAPHAQGREAMRMSFSLTVPLHRQQSPKDWDSHPQPGGEVKYWDGIFSQCAEFELSVTTLHKVMGRAW